jgi:hypothetical protein
VHDVTKDNETGTCVMMDMTYEGIGYDTFPLRSLEKGVKEMTRLPYHKQVLIMNHLKAYLSKQRKYEEAMNQCVADLMLQYKKKARKATGPSLNKPAVADGIGNSQHRNPMIHVSGDASMNAVTDGPAVGAACESPKHQESQTHVQHTVSHNNCQHLKYLFA